MQVLVLSCRRRMAAFNRATFRTADGHNLTVSGAVPYHITSVKELMMCTDMGEDTLMKLSGSLCREYAEGLSLSRITAAEMGVYVATQMTESLRGIVVQPAEFVDFAELRTHHLLITNPWGNTYSGGTLNLSTPMGAGR